MAVQPAGGGADTATPTRPRPVGHAAMAERAEAKSRRDRGLDRRAHPVRSTVTGARFDPLLNFEDWRELGAKLGVYDNATRWWLGDWLVFGRMKYGRRYKDAVVATGLDYQTLRNYAMVARRFEASRRRADLTFQHHATVCTLTNDDQDIWLDRAAAEGWSRNELRRQLRAAAGAPPSEDEMFRLVVARRQGALWRRAAAQSRCTCEAWIVRVLDEAAAALIGDDASTAQHMLYPAARAA